MKPQTSNWNPWPAAIIGFFAFAIAGCAAFVVFCCRHPADLVAVDYYDQEMRYQDQIDRIYRAHASQPMSVQYDRAQQLIVISLPAGHSNAVGTVQLYRPSSSSLDQTMPLQPDSAGVQTINAKSLLPGLWKVRVCWRLGGRDFFREQSLVIGGTG